MSRDRARRSLVQAVLAGALCLPTASLAQDTVQATPRLVERDLSGPRFGFTIRPNGSPGAWKDVGPVVSQFGWHFEHHISPEVAGPQFVTEFVPLVAGVEYGRFLPSMSFGVGVRLPRGLEFGLGPSLSVTRDENGNYAGRSALFFALGQTFDYAGVHIPLNVVLSTNKDGSRVSLMTGYAIRRSARKVES